jgi:hypothetical protein
MSSRKVLHFVRNKWFPLFVLLLLLVPPYASKGYPLSEVLQLNAFILTHSIKHGFVPIYPVFITIALMILASIIIYKRAVSCLFAIYAGLSYILFAVVQNVSITEEYGVAICLSNVALFLVVSASWFYEVKARENDFTARDQPKWRWLFFLIALLAIWFPVDRRTMETDFNPLYLLSSGSGLIFCMMTTVYLSVLLYFFPRINLCTLCLTSLVGLLIGLGNLWLEFIYHSELWWVGVLHLPLVVMSNCGLRLCYHEKKSDGIYGGPDV